MSTPKKPGTDLAALKARLAKKNQPAQAPPMNVPPPGEVVAPPTPPEPPTAASAAPFHADVPPPGQAMHVPPPGQAMHVPPPGTVAQPQPAMQQVSQMAHAAAPGADGDDPFGGVGVGGFDPTDGVLDAGVELAGRGGKGLVIFASAIAVAFGCMAGWLGHKIIDTRERVKIGREKGAKMASEVEAIADRRKSISLAMEDVEKKIATNPAEGSKVLEELLKEHFDKHPKIEELFGWQLASVHPMGIKRAFDLYDEANRLKLDIARLVLHLNTHGSLLENDTGPLLFALLSKGNGAQLVVALAPLCGGGQDLEALTPCESDGNEAVAYMIQDTPTSEPRRVWRGTDSDQATMLLTDGVIYQVAIGEKPERNAAVIRDQKIGWIKERLEAMAKAERTAIAALQHYADNPNVDGSNPGPNPEGDE